jgi:hypothetical protein
MLFSFHFLGTKFRPSLLDTRWFKYDRDYLCLNKSQFVPVIFEPPCIMLETLVYSCSTQKLPSASCAASANLICSDSDKFSEGIKLMK